MLLFLTGDIQTGKTRWLMRLADELAGRDIQVCGVIAPGVWIERDDERADANGYEKLGIDNLLLPQRRIVPFARRRDLAQADNAYDEGSQSARADLLWAIDDGAIGQVNAHFDALSRMTEPGRRLLVVDEFGRLELLRGEGLTSAVALIDRGAGDVFQHALVVVRAQLLDIAHERFASAAWGGMRDVLPADDAMAELAKLFG